MPCLFFFRQTSERIKDPVFYDTKIERAGGREIVSRSRSTRHKRNSKSDSLYHRSQRIQDYKNESFLKNSYESQKSVGGGSSLINSR